MADEKLNTGPAENIFPEAAEPIATPEQAAASEPQQEQTGQAQQTGVVGGHRALGERLARKDGQSDVVGRTARDKLVGHILRRLHAVRLQILGKHGCRNVHGKHDIDALHRLVVPRIVRLRAGHGANDEHEGDASQHHRQMDESHAQALGRKLIHSCIAHAHRRLALLPAQKIP